MSSGRLCDWVSRPSEETIAATTESLFRLGLTDAVVPSLVRLNRRFRRALNAVLVQTNGDWQAAVSCFPPVREGHLSTQIGRMSI